MGRRFANTKLDVYRRHCRGHDPGGREDQRRDSHQSGHDGAHYRAAVCADGLGVYETQSGNKKAAGHAYRTAKRSGGQRACQTAARLGAESAVSRRAKAHDRLVLREQGPQRGGAYLRANADGALRAGIFWRRANFRSIVIMLLRQPLMELGSRRPTGNLCEYRLGSAYAGESRPFRRGCMSAGLLAFFIALFASMMLAVPVRELALRVGMVDLPGPRKVHLHPIPLLGGLAMYGGVMLAIIFAFDGPARPHSPGN